MRTVAYVDGYNLYHGRLKHTVVVKYQLGETDVD